VALPEISDGHKQKRHRYQSPTAEPEFGTFLSAEHWQDEGMPLVHSPPIRQSRRIKSPQRNIDNYMDKVINENDSGIIVRYIKPRYNDEKSAAPHYDIEEMDEAVPHAHVLQSHDDAQPHCPYCRQAQDLTQSQHGDEESGYYLPYHRFAARAHPLDDYEMALSDPLHQMDPVGSSYSAVPVGYQAATQMEQHPDSQEDADRKTKIISGEKNLQALFPMHTEAELQRISKNLDFGSAETQVEDMTSIGEMGRHGGSVRKINEGPEFKMEEVVTNTEDSVDDKVNTTVPLRPALKNEAKSST
jgi:hypothetical protein